MQNLTCETFARLIPHFDGSSAAGRHEGVSYGEWCAHLHACEACADRVLEHRVAKWNVDVSAFPCIHMAYRASQSCPLHENRDECPDLVIGYDEVFDEYSIIKEGVSLSISYCPWCGKRLPQSQRERWFAELERLLGPNPLSDRNKIPQRYRSREWRA